MVLMVKETKTVEREFTIDEECMYCIMMDCSYGNGIREAADQALESVGFAGITCGNEHGGYFRSVAKFKTVVEREATHAELTAYYLLKCIGKEMCCVDSHKECAACPFYDIEFECSEVRDKCLEIIKDKEFYEKED